MCIFLCESVVSQIDNIWTLQTRCSFGRTNIKKIVCLENYFIWFQFGNNLLGQEIELPFPSRNNNKLWPTLYRLKRFVKLRLVDGCEAWTKGLQCVFQEMFKEMNCKIEKKVIFKSGWSKSSSKWSMQRLNLIRILSLDIVVIMLLQN